MAKVTPVLWKGKKNNRGEHPIYLRIEAAGKRQYLSLRTYIKPKHWNEKGKCVRSSLKGFRDINETINQKVAEAKGHIYRLSAEGHSVTPAEVKKAMLPRKKEEFDFLAYGGEYAEELRRNGCIPTSRRYFSILRKLGIYCNGSLPFTAVSLQFLRAYRTHLIEDYGNAPSTLASNFRALKAITNRALDERLVSYDEHPFRGFEVKEPRSQKRKLTFSEIEAIRNVIIEPNSPVWHVRNYFLFSVYCAGIRFRDLCLLRIKNVLDGRLSYIMSKTKNPKNIDIPPIAGEILSQYKIGDRDREDRVFPVLDGYDLSTPEKLDRSVQSRNALVNKNLKKLAVIAVINPDLSFHMSRHSFADLALKAGWGIKKIQSALGHSNVRVTENYLKDFDPEFIGTELSTLFSES